MYVQHCVKGIGARQENGRPFDWDQAKAIVDGKEGILCNAMRLGGIKYCSDIPPLLTEDNLYRHLHHYKAFGNDTPFISLTSGAVTRNVLVRRNFVYSAIDTALGFATDSWAHPGALFYLWVMVGNDRAVQVESLAEPVRDLNIYHRWSRYQHEGEIAAKVRIPANQIEKVEWWDPRISKDKAAHTHQNLDYFDPQWLSARWYF